MKKRVWLIIATIVGVLAIAGGVTYYHMSHVVAQKVPGHVYQYQSSNGSKSLYIAFATSGDKVVVNQNKDIAMNAQKSQSNFDSEYTKQSKDATWNYKADGSKLTLAQQKPNNQLSQWQYNSILATNKKFTSHSFTYQIAKAGQGNVSKKTVFTRLDQ